jgi:hypothetical protein
VGEGVLISSPDGAEAQPAPDPVEDKKGSRLPKDWSLPDKWRDWALDKHDITEAALAQQAESFRDYWVGKPGQGGRKLDWFATWRNWIRDKFRLRSEAPPAPEAPADLWWKDPAKVAAITPERWREGIAKYANGIWPTDKLGPPPGTVDCVVPKDIVVDLKLEDRYTRSGIAKRPH